MSTQVISQRYARALMGLAAGKGAAGKGAAGKGTDKQVEEIGAALDEVSVALAAEELAPFLASSQATPAMRDEVLKTVLARMKAPAPLPAFVRLLNQKRRLDLLPEIARLFHQLADERLGRAQAEVTVAEPLPAAQKERLRKQLEQATGKSVTLNVQVDGQILGGAVTRIGSTVWDGSVRHHLHQIREQLLRG